MEGSKLATKHLSEQSLLPTVATSQSPCIPEAGHFQEASWEFEGHRSVKYWSRFQNLNSFARGLAVFLGS